MENIAISSITNTLVAHTVILRDDQDREIVLHPGERLDGMSRLSIPFLTEGSPFLNEAIRYFRTERPGEVTSFYYISRENSGIISALGPNEQDFWPPSNLHTSIPNVSPGQTVSLRFFLDSDNITWIIGDIDGL